MMSIQHERLVLFLGAGVLTEPQNQVRVLFSVQVIQLCCIEFGVNRALFVWSSARSSVRLHLLEKLLYLCLL